MIRCTNFMAEPTLDVHNRRYGTLPHRKVGRNASAQLVAAEFHVSRRHLTRLFGEEIGRSMLDYTQNLRVERAKDLLQQTRMSVLEIAP
jgi:transcriptional regulator GlxA family with amidase domain